MAGCMRATAVDACDMATRLVLLLTVKHVAATQCCCPLLTAHSLELLLLALEPLPAGHKQPAQACGEQLHGRSSCGLWPQRH